jgi:protein SCO1/2
MENKRLTLICLLLAITSQIGGANAFASTQEPPIQNKVRFEQKLGEKIPLQTSLTDERGDFLPLGQIAGNKPHVLVFSYYNCPNLCTLVLNGLVQALKQIPEKLGNDFDVLTVSINPEEQASLALMKQRTYLARLGEISCKDWHFLVGSKRSIQTLTDSVGFHFERDPLSGEYNHPSGIVILSPNGKIIRYLFGIRFDPNALSDSLRDAKVGRIGSLAEEILLYCFHYVPGANKNGKTIIALVRLLGLIGAFGLLALLIHLSKSRRDPIA